MQVGVAHGERTQKQRVPDGVQFPAPTARMYPGTSSATFRQSIVPFLRGPVSWHCRASFYSCQTRPVAQYLWGVGSAGLRLSGAAAALAMLAKRRPYFGRHTQCYCGTKSSVAWQYTITVLDTDQGALGKSSSVFGLRTVKLSKGSVGAPLLTKAYGKSIRSSTGTCRFLQSRSDTILRGNNRKLHSNFFQHSRQV